MAIKKKSDMQMSQFEKPITTPEISQESTASPNNDDIFDHDNPKEDTPVTDPGLKDELKILQNLKEAQLNVTDSSEAIRHLAGTKTSVIYYNQVQLQVNGDTINVTSATDAENKTLFNRIDNMIINTDSELNAAFEINDGVAKNEITSSGLIFPGFTPFPGDLFYVNEKIGRGILYKIINVEPLAQVIDTGFKIEFQRHYDQMQPEQLENKVERHFVFNFEAVGSSKSVVLERSIYDVYRKIKEAFTKVSEEYTHRFYDKNKNIIRWNRLVEPDLPDFKYLQNLNFQPVEPHVENTFDPYIMRFFAKTGLQSRLTYRRYAVFPESPFNENEIFEKIYRNSVFYAIHARKPSVIKEIYTVTKRFQTKSLREQAYKGWYYFDVSRSLEDQNHVKIYPDNLVSRIATNSLYSKEHDNLDLLKYNMIIEFVNNKKYYPDMETVEAFIDEIEFIPDDELFGAGPLILYIFDYYIDSIETKSM
ncbi:MAG: hypothetical protein J5614_00490 [Paludibacteraceae bacterium]|nr:hypothetical protein [Paludibacteraceae bacterium]